MFISQEHKVKVLLLKFPSAVNCRGIVKSAAVNCRGVFVSFICVFQPSYVCQQQFSYATLVCFFKFKKKKIL